MAIAGADAQSPIDRPVRIGETLTGAVDGINTVFTTAAPFVFDVPFEAPAVYLNGMRLRGGGVDYTESESGGLGAGFDTITTTEPPRATVKAVDVLSVDYTEQ